MAVPNKVSYFPASVGLLTDVDTVQRNILGSRQFGDDGSEFIYLNGVASVAAGDWVVFGVNIAPYATIVRMVNDANSGVGGAVAVAMSAVNATTSFGWFQIFGLTQANVNIATTASVGVALYRSGTTARAAASAVAKDCIYGAYTAAASVANVGQAFLTYPKVIDQSTL